MNIQWLRKYDPVKCKYTNLTMPYSKELSLDGNWKMISAEEKVACDAALAVEKKQAALAKRMEQAIVNAPMPSKIDKMQDKPNAPTLPVKDEDDEVTENTPEPDDEPLQMALDDLDDMSKAQLQEVIDNEDLPVTKVGNKTVLMTAIREARKAKAAAPVDA